MRGLYPVAEPASQRISVDVGIGEPTQKKVSIVPESMCRMYQYGRS